MSNLLKNLLFVLALLVIVYVGYTVFFSGGSSVTTAGGGLDTAMVKAQGYLNKLRTVQGIHIDSDMSVLRDQRFTALKDLRQDLGTEQTGRTDPFAPVPKQ